MCLDVMHKHKKLFSDSWKAKKLRKDLYVYKVLSRLNSGEIVTPYMKMQIKFKKGACSLYEYSRDVFEDVTRDEEYYCRNHDKIKYFFHYKRATKYGQGYHAYLKHETAKEEVAYWNRTGFVGVTGGSPRSARVYRALIPKGSYVFYGYDGDICANKMVIFENKTKV